MHTDIFTFILKCTCGVHAYHTQKSVHSFLLSLQLSLPIIKVLALYFSPSRPLALALSRSDGRPNLTTRGRLIRRVPGVSVVCRLVDGNRRGEFQTAFGNQTTPARISSRYLPPGTAAEYTAARRKGKGKTVLESLVDLRTDTGAHKIETLKAFLRATQLKGPS